MQADQGILTGCDINHEWMLKWWWDHYTKCNDYPVAFCDFGMSKSARMWCETKGTLLTAPKHFLKEMSPSSKANWEDLHPDDIWSNRNIWFKKPLLLPHTPFKKSIWMDVDCEVKQPLSSLFEILTQNDFAVCQEVPRGIAVRREKGLLFPDENAYLTGVIAYKNTSPIIKKWVENCLKRNHEFFSEQDALNRTIYEENFSLKTLSSRFNYAPCTDCQKPKNLVIYHHPFLIGKSHILQSHSFE